MKTDTEWFFVTKDKCEIAQRLCDSFKQFCTLINISNPETRHFARHLIKFVPALVGVTQLEDRRDVTIYDGRNLYNWIAKYISDSQSSSQEDSETLKASTEGTKLFEFSTPTPISAAAPKSPKNSYPEEVAKHSTNPAIKSNSRAPANRKYDNETVEEMMKARQEMEKEVAPRPGGG